MRKVFVPWDPLQLNKEIVSGARVVPDEIGFPLYKHAMFRRPRYWRPSLDPAAAFFFDDSSILKENLRSISKRLHGYDSSLVYSHYDFTGSSEEDFYTSKLTASFMNYSGSFYSFIENLFVFCNKVRDYRLTVPSYEFNKKSHIIVVSISDDQCDVITSDIRVQEKLLKLFDFVDERMFFLFLCKTPSKLPRVFIDSLSYVSFIGDENIKFAQDFYQQKPLIRNVHTEVVANVYCKLSDELYNVSSFIHRPTSIAIARREALQKEEEDYYAFLESLEEGD